MEDSENKTNIEFCDCCYRENCICEEEEFFDEDDDE